MADLAALLAGMPGGQHAWHGPKGPIDVAAVTTDSRSVTPGTAFVATHHRGYAQDGHAYVSDAVRRGAVAVIVERLPSGDLGVPVIVVRSTALALAHLAAGLAGWPSSRLAVVGVTGTDGKTTTSIMAHAILQAAGRSAGLVATIATGVGGALMPNAAHVTTPDAVSIQAVLSSTLEAGGTAAVLEATSHGLDQSRVDAIEFDVAVVTRVTHDHLDYHGTHEAYLEAKAGLLDRLAPGSGPAKVAPVPKVAAILASDPAFDFLATRARRAGATVTAFATGDGVRPATADRMVRARGLATTAWGTAAVVETPWGRGHLEVRLPGEFNVLNALAALAATAPLGVPLDVALPAIAGLASLPGRMARIEGGQPFVVVIDFAHTPDSLANALREMRARASGRVLVVFGAAGERDRAKRPAMGRVAATLADFAVLTDEDPRMEDREAILADIAGGAVEAGAREGDHFARVADRRDAIRRAVGMARRGDVVLLAGKGHETSIDGSMDGVAMSMPWDEASVAREVLAEYGWGAGPEAGRAS